MKFGSPEHRLLRLLWKFSKGRVVDSDKITTGGTIDIDKVKALLIEKGFTLPEARDAFQLLVLAGYCGDKGQITPTGTTRLQNIETSYRADLDASPLSALAMTGFGEPDQTTLNLLAAKDY